MATIEALKSRNLDELVLGDGPHGNPENGVCLMEAVAYWANEPHSDHPQCACPVLTSYGVCLNDSFPEEQRQRLKAFIPRLVGSRNPELEQKRMWLFADAAVRIFAPASLLVAAEGLKRAGLVKDGLTLEKHAETLKALPVVDSESAAWSAGSAAESAAEAAESAGSAAASAAESAAWSAESAGSAAWSAEAAESAASAAWSAESAESAARSGANIYDAAIEAFERAIALGTEAQ